MSRRPHPSWSSRIREDNPAHVPIRRCLGCGSRRPQPELARFVAERTDSGYRLAYDPRRVLPGRGLYTCPHRACFVRARRGAFARAARVGGGLVVEPDLELRFEGER
ncbi:MAG: YlxR family protein [Actinobacteria bacterium]|nr:YlxR family protein [Actinomycetota bacterium]